MAWRILIDGVDRTRFVSRQAAGSISLSANERSTANFTFIKGYYPPMRAEVQIYEQDGSTLIFGGLVYNRTFQIEEHVLVSVDVEFTDWSFYLGRRVNGGYGSATVSLKQVLEDLVTLYLSDYGITLDPGQVTGPTGSSPGLNWVAKTAADVIRDLTTLSAAVGESYVATLSPTKVLKMAPPSLSPAPFALTNTSKNFVAIVWTESGERYATRVVLECGGSGEKEITQTWTVSPADISNGYLETDAPSNPTAGVAATVNSNPVSIGGPGSDLVWDWTSHRITAGNLVPNVGDVVALTYTGVFPIIVEIDSGDPLVIDYYEKKDDISTRSAAILYGTGLLTALYQDARELEIETRTPGLRPAQELTLNVDDHDLNGIVGITKVDISVPGEGPWEYQVSAVAGAYQGSPLDFFRSLEGGGGGAVMPSFSGGANPAVLQATNAYLGGSRNTSVAPASNTYVPVVGYVPISFTASFSGRVRVTLWSTSGSAVVTAQLWDQTALAPAGNSSGITSTSPVMTSFNVQIDAGHVYWLEIMSDTTDARIFGIGSLEGL